MECSLRNKINHLNSNPNHIIHFTNDLGNDFGLPKGTALVRNAIYPFSMGNEAFDGFLVMELHTNLSDSQLVTRFTDAIRTVLIDKVLPGVVRKEFCEQIISEANNIVSTSKGQLSLSNSCYWDTASAKSILSILLERMIGTLGTLRPDSLGKFVELCKGDSGQHYIVVHCGVSAMQNTLFYLLHMYGKNTDQFSMKGLNKFDVRLLDLHLDLSSSLSQSILLTLDCLKLFASYNRQCIADSVCNLMGLTSSFRIIFNEVHASIERVYHDQYLHQNSINRAHSGMQIGFVAGPPSYLLRLQSDTPHFYPHSINTNFQDSFSKDQHQRIVCSETLFPLVNNKDLK
jgi:hypothetical protein